MGVEEAGGRATRIARVVVELMFWGGLVLLAFSVASVVWNVLGAIFIVPLALGLVGLYWLRDFLRDVTAGQVFTVLNARRLSRIGWLLIAVALLRVVLPFFFGGLVSFYSPMMVLPMLLAIVGNGLLIGGLLLLVIAAAWRYGTELQSERDLTV
jgi:hypothetical protein